LAGKKNHVTFSLAGKNLRLLLVFLMKRKRGYTRKEFFLLHSCSSFRMLIKL